MTDNKKRPEYPGPFPYHPRCHCTICGLDDVTVAQLKAIAEETDQMIMEALRVADLTEYYEHLEGHFERRH